MQLAGSSIVRYILVQFVVTIHKNIHPVPDPWQYNLGECYRTTRKFLLIKYTKKMLQFQENKVCKLIDLLDTNITPSMAVLELSKYFNIQKADILSTFSIVHLVVPVPSTKYKFILVKV